MVNYNRTMEITHVPSVVATKHKIAGREARIGITGIGCTCLPSVLQFGNQSFKVAGFDIAADKVKPTTLFPVRGVYVGEGTSGCGDLKTEDRPLCYPGSQNRGPGHPEWSRCGFIR
jgi:hypothetical protein